MSTVLINTPLQRGGPQADEGETVSNGFEEGSFPRRSMVLPRWARQTKPLETVRLCPLSGNPSMNRGVNEIAEPGAGENVEEPLHEANALRPQPGWLLYREPARGWVQSATTNLLRMNRAIAPAASDPLPPSSPMEGSSSEVELWETNGVPATMAGRNSSSDQPKSFSDVTKSSTPKAAMAPETQVSLITLEKPTTNRPASCSDRAKPFSPLQKLSLAKQSASSAEQDPSSPAQAALWEVEESATAERPAKPERDRASHPIAVTSVTAGASWKVVAQTCQARSGSLSPLRMGTTDA
jgi:hypothetical protein